LIRKTLSYCVKDVSGQIQQEGKAGSTRRELDCWDEDSAPAMERWHGGNDLQRMDLRSSASACCADQLRYWRLLVRHMVQMKTGVEYNKQQLHKASYFSELLSEGVQGRSPVDDACDSSGQEEASRHTTAVEAQPGDDRALPEDRVRSGQFSSARPDAGRSGSRGSERFPAQTRSRH
jgi:hypothetical protein